MNTKFNTITLSAVLILSIVLSSSSGLLIVRTKAQVQKSQFSPFASSASPSIQQQRPSSYVDRGSTSNTPSSPSPSLSPSQQRQQQQVQSPIADAGRDQVVYQ